MLVCLSVFNFLILTFSALSNLEVKTCPRHGRNWFIYEIFHYLAVSLLTTSVGWYRILIGRSVLNSRTFERLPYSFQGLQVNDLHFLKTQFCKYRVIGEMNISKLNSVQKLCGTGFSQFMLLYVVLGPTSL